MLTVGAGNIDTLYDPIMNWIGTLKKVKIRKNSDVSFHEKQVENSQNFLKVTIVVIFGFLLSFSLKRFNDQEN